MRVNRSGLGDGGYGGNPSGGEVRVNRSGGNFRPYPGGAASRPAAKPSAASPTAQPLMEVAQGDGVEHTAFGKGTVLSVKPMGGDALIEVAFETKGTKKLMLKSAGAHMKKV